MTFWIWPWQGRCKAGAKYIPPILHLNKKIGSLWIELNSIPFECNEVQGRLLWYL